MKELSLQWEERKHRLDVFIRPKEIRSDLLEQSNMSEDLPVVKGVIKVHVVPDNLIEI
jgi:hypothetical protein